ncbi:MAG: helix-turn-helix domain-containing protein [Gammaproteobacteria bacterium]|nr:helix-turn-helix domain-containing protein [Gammaproteobacteria bacterium]
MAFDATPQNRISNECLVCPVNQCLGRSGGGCSTRTGFETLASRRAVMPGSGALYHVGDSLRSLYSVRAGCLKAYTVDAEGNERIRGFYLPGDAIGLDAIGEGRCMSTVVAVAPSQVCVAPLDELKPLMLRQPLLATRMIEQTSRELALALSLSGDFTADQRLAAFLLYMRQRLGGGALRLPMSQRDIGNYLRLATETVCRTLKSFGRKNWIAPGERLIRIIDEYALQRLAAPVGLLHDHTDWAQAA